MAEKWMVKEESGGENMPLYYAVYDETARQVSMHYAREDAKQMAAFPQIRDALYEALAFIDEVARSFGVEPDKDAWERMSNALQVELLPAAKGE